MKQRKEGHQVAGQKVHSSLSITSYRKFKQTFWPNQYYKWTKQGQTKTL